MGPVDRFGIENDSAKSAAAPIFLLFSQSYTGKFTNPSAEFQRIFHRIGVAGSGQDLEPGMGYQLRSFQAFPYRRQQVFGSGQEQDRIPDRPQSWPNVPLKSAIYLMAGSV
jgi:hypothetical protein